MRSASGMLIQRQVSSERRGEGGKLAQMQWLKKVLLYYNKTAVLCILNS